MEPRVKGWMSSTGVPYLIANTAEHALNLPPGVTVKGARRSVSDDFSGVISCVLAQGFVRFGRSPSSMHGSHIFVHYDGKHPKGPKTALLVLDYLKPEPNEPIAISGYRGDLWGRRITRDLSERVTTVSKARQWLRLRKKMKEGKAA